MMKILFLFLFSFSVFAVEGPIGEINKGPIKKLEKLKKVNLTTLDIFGRPGDANLGTGGFSSGGGGNAVVCWNSDKLITEVSLLDYFEGIRKDITLEKRIDLKGDTLDEKIKYAFKRMGTRFPYLAKKLRNRALWLASRIDYFLMSSEDGRLTPIYDMNLPFVPNQNEAGDKCQIVRFAVQLTRQLSGQKKFYFVKELFNHPKTSLSSKAGIILHEVLYEEAIKNGSTDSDFVRWFTYLISSTTFDQMNDKEFAK